jgi:hypothetical protein
MAMLVFTPIYNFGIYVPLTGSHVPFSHAFFGAYRHALTVGFIMMMIVGVSSKVVPTLSGVDVRRAGSLWPTFLLLLIDDHGSLDKVLRELQTALQNSDLKTAHVKLDLFWARLAVHIRAEHLHLFPTILSSFENAAGSHVSAPSLDEAKTVVAQLRQDHDFFMHQLAVAVKIMRELLTLPEQLTDSDGMNNVKKILLEVQRRLVNHHELEENQIYRWATLLLNSEEQQKLREQITKELQNRPARFTLSTWSDE